MNGLEEWAAWKVGEGGGESGVGLLCKFYGLSTVRVELCCGCWVKDGIGKADAEEFMKEGGRGAVVR